MRKKTLNERVKYEKTDEEEKEGHAVGPQVRVVAPIDPNRSSHENGRKRRNERKATGHQDVVTELMIENIWYDP